MTKNWHRMKPGERRLEQRRRDLKARLIRPTYRCRYCRVVVDENTRAGHLSRCAEFAKAGTVARGAPLDEHFTEET